MLQVQTERMWITSCSSIFLLHLHRRYGLILCSVEQYGLIFHLVEFYCLQVKLPYGAVVHRAVVYRQVLHVCGRCPLRCAWNVGWSLAVGKLNAYGYVEVVEYLETLQHGFFDSLFFGAVA